MQGMKFIGQVLVTFWVTVLSAYAALPVPYSGKIDIQGVNYFGEAQFAFSLYDGNGTTHWRNGNQPKETIKVTIRNGRYNVLLGGQGMNSLPPELFLKHDELFLKVEFDNGDGKGLRHLAPDQLITATPRALVADIAKLSEVAKVAEKVGNGVITREMLSQEVLSQLDANATASPSAPVTITRDMLPASVLNDLNKSVIITRAMLPQDVRDDLNSTIGMNRLSAQVILKLDQNVSGGAGVVAGSLISVPYGQSAPDGYSLYQRGTPKELVWEEKAPVSVARLAFDGVEVLDGKIYFVGGNDGSAKNIAERYDPATNTWESLNSMSVARGGVASAVLNGKVYAISGAGLSSVEVFSPSEDTWTTGLNLPSEVFLGQAITVDGKIYLIGGNNQVLNQVLCFDLSTNQWSAKADMPTGRYGHKLVWFESRIWAIGGYNFGPSSKVESYDISSNSWQDEASLTSTRHLPTAWVANNRIYVAGGRVSNSLVNTLESYNPKTKEWSNAGNFPEKTFVADSVVLNDKVYVIGGSPEFGVYSDKVYAADLNASVEGVYDLYRKTITKEILAQDILSDLNAAIGLDRLSSEVISELNSSGVEDNSVTMAKLEPQLRADLNKTTSRPFGATLANPYGILGTPITGTNYIVPSGKVLVITNSGSSMSQNYQPQHFRSQESSTSFIPEGTSITPITGFRWTGYLFNNLEGITPITGTNYTVPSDKFLVITSSGTDMRINNQLFRFGKSSPSIIPSGHTVTITSGYGWTGYLIDPNKFL